ncbi:MAG: winged helix-turn-helix transcriptional regulator, partial [Promethearchaeota archaeon]
LNQSTWLCLNFTINSISNCTTYEIYSSKILFDFINDTLLFEHIYIGNSSLDKNKFPNSFGRLDLEDFLNKNPSIIGNHRLSIKDVIRNEYRSTILQKIINTPGIHNNELLRQCNLQKGQLQWHLQILIQYGLIKKKKEGQFSLFFPSFISQDINQSYNILLIKSKTTMKVLDKIENNPGINPSMVASELEISRSSVKYHVDKLIQENIISHRRKGRNVELYLNGNDT